MENICQTCGKAFDAPPSAKRKFCSRECFHKSPQIHISRPKSIETKMKLSTTRKKMYATGLNNPMLGKKRPDLARRNKERIVYTFKKVREIFGKYRAYKGGLRGFAKTYGYSSRYLHELFRKHIDKDDLNMVMESKKGLSSTYKKGRRFEWRVRDYFKNKGYFVLRSPRSASPVDLVAIKKGEILLVQCKIGGYLAPREREQLFEIADSIGAKPVLVWREVRPPTYPIKIEPIRGKVQGFKNEIIGIEAKFSRM